MILSNYNTRIWNFAIYVSVTDNPTNGWEIEIENEKKMERSEPSIWWREEREGKTAEVAEREAEEEIKHLVAAESFWVARYVLP